MKKTICILISLVMVFTLIGCSHSKLPDTAQGIAKDVVAFTEQYLQGDMSADDAFLMMGYYSDQLDALPEPENSDQSTGLTLLQTYVSLLETDFLLYDTDEGIKEHLDKVKELL